jgi:hypothetical protein
MSTKERLILVGQILQHARNKGKLLSENVIRAINKIESKARVERVSQANIDLWIRQGRDIIRYKEEMNDNGTRNVKHLI